MSDYTVGTEIGSITTTNGDYTTTEYNYGLYNPNNCIITGITEWEPNNKKGDDDMRYLYEVILVNPKNDTFYVNKVIAKSETSALMTAYNQYKGGLFGTDTCIPFDDLKTNCKILMSWTKEKSLNKAIETIKEAVE